MAALHRGSSAATSHTAELPLLPTLDRESLRVLSGQLKDGEPMPPEVVRHVVAVAGAAPSVFNTQPWRFHSDGFVLDLYADRDRQLHRGDPAGRQLAISCGAALHHALLAFRGLGREAQLQLAPGPEGSDHLARLIPGSYQAELPTPDQWAWLHAIGDRHSYRAALRPQRLSRQLVVELQEAAALKGCGLRPVERPGERADLAELLIRANTRLAADTAAREELLEWSRWEDEADEPLVDGIPRSVVPPATPATINAHFPQRNFDVDGSVGLGSDLGEGVSGEDPDIAALWTPGDTVADWLYAGVALSAVLLAATCAGASASLLNQPLEEPVMRTQMQGVLMVPGPVQLVLRLGYSERYAQPRVTPRRPVADYLTFS